MPQAWRDWCVASVSLLSPAWNKATTFLSPHHVYVVVVAMVVVRRVRVLERCELPRCVAKQIRAVFNLQFCRGVGVVGFVAPL